MKDTEWQKVIIDCCKAKDEHSRLMAIAEREYERRYGHSPSDVDDDWWIDTVHYGRGSVDLKKIKESADLHLSRKK